VSGKGAVGKCRGGEINQRALSFFLTGKARTTVRGNRPDQKEMPGPKQQMSAQNPAGLRGKKRVHSCKQHQKGKSQKPEISTGRRSAGRREPTAQKQPVD